MDLARGAPPPARLLAALGAVAAGLTAFGVWLGLRYGRGSGLALWMNVVLALCFVTAGIATWRLRPRSRTGPWMLAAGLVALVENPHSFRLLTQMPGRAGVELIGVPAYWVQWAIVGHLLLGYPSGRLRDRADRAVVAVAFTVAFGGALALLLTQTPDPAICHDWCGPSPVRLVASRGIYLAILAAVTVMWVALAGTTLALLARRFIRSGPRQRRVLRFPFAMAGLSIVLFAAVMLAYLAADTGRASRTAVTVVGYGMVWGGVLALPVAFLAGLLRERLDFASVGDLVRGLEHAGTDTLEARLRHTLRDPTLRVAFPMASGWVDVSGRPFEPPRDSGRVATLLGDPPVAVLVHDPTLAENPDLLTAAGAAARLALDNARLHAQVQAQLIEVRASRQRIVAAADAERRRLERDLHDGAQQRLLGIGMALGMLRARLTAASADADRDGRLKRDGRVERDGRAERDLVDEIERELRAAIGELRELARGIRPAVLTDQGLAPALAGLARRAGILVTVDVALTRRLDPLIEATAYYIVSEALQNVAKHADGSGARIRVAHERGRLIIDVEDDGPGGASMFVGSGLRGLADRAEAVGGLLRVRSPSGHDTRGTNIHAELPIA